MNEQYKFNRHIEYLDNGKLIQMTILMKEQYNNVMINKLLYIDYLHYINEHKSKKISKNNIVKFFNENGIDCIISKK